MIKRLKNGEKAPLTAHIGELRQRMMYSVAVIGVLFAGMFAVSDMLLIPFADLMQGEKMVFISPTEAFFAHLKISFYAALGLSVPFLLHQTWTFVSPGLMKKEKLYALGFGVSSAIFFAGGASFCFFVVLPFGLSFLIGYGGELLTPMLTVSNVLGFSLTLMFIFGIVFQLPIVLIFLNMVGILYPGQLTQFRPYLIVISFVLSAIITPPDIFTQVVLSLPIILLYEMSIILIRFFGKKDAEESEEEKKAEEKAASPSTEKKKERFQEKLARLFGLTLIARIFRRKKKEKIKEEKKAEEKTAPPPTEKEEVKAAEEQVSPPTDESEKRDEVLVDEGAVGCKGDDDSSDECQ